MNKWTRGRHLVAITGVVGLTLVGSVTFAGPAQALSLGDILSPLGIGVSTCIYQGYDTSPPGGTHNGTSEYGLDLVTGSCSSTATSGLDAYAPLNGTVSYWQASYGNLCVNTSDGRSYTLTHINASVTRGVVIAGELLGTVAAAQPDPNLAPHNNNVSHIHFQIWSAANCYNSSVIPFDTADNARICGAPDLTATSPNGGNNGTWSNTSFTGQSCGSISPPLPPGGASPIQNGGFNGSTAHWSTSGTANLAYYTSASGTGTNPYEGSGYAATNASQSGDSISETNTATIRAGDTWCASAEVVTVGNATGGSGTLAIWLTGGTTNDSSTFAFNSLPGNNNWKPANTCVTATTAQSYVKVQVYPTPGGSTIGMDAVDVHQTLNANGGFNSGMDYWNAMPGTNYVAYASADNTGTNPYEGYRFGATNTATSGGSIYQDLPHTIAVGDTFCASAQVVTVGNTTGAAGALYVYLTGTNATEQSDATFSGLPGGNSWSPIKTCVTATAAHTTIHVQLYPAVGGHTVGVDALDVHSSIIQNGGFNVDSSHWGTTGGLSYMQYSSYNSTLPFEGSGFEVIQASSSSDSLAESRSWQIGVGDTFCVSSEVITPGYGSGASGTLAIWLLGANGAENSTYSFSTLPGGNNWTEIKTCATATIAESYGTIQVQLYPTPGGAPVGVDVVDVH